MRIHLAHFQESACAVKEADIERNEGVAHPEAHLLRPGIYKQHSLVLWHRAAVHQPFGHFLPANCNLGMQLHVANRQFKQIFYRCRDDIIIPRGLRACRHKKYANAEQGPESHLQQPRKGRKLRKNVDLRPQANRAHPCFMSENVARLLYADTSSSADALYFGKVHVPDAFIALDANGVKIAVLSALEFDRVSKEGTFDRILPLEALEDEARQKTGDERPTPGQLIALLMRDLSIDRVRVGAAFPAAVLRQLERCNLKVDVADGSLFPERELKTRDEAEQVRKGNAASAAGFRAVEEILKNSTIVGNRLVYEGEPVTSEFLRQEIEIACIRSGARATGTIVAGGDQGCDPHCEGSGELRPNELIVVDIFPRMSDSGYHGDMTRTYLKGRASEDQRKLVATVAEAQRRALGAIKPGKDGIALYQATREFFDGRGYQTGKKNGLHVGFFHGLGHGLGLEVHEPPRMGRVGAPLKIGHIVTVEPGLYYPGLGGCRIEDVVWITQDGYEIVSEHPYEWEFA